jgi:hypothetical protein
MDARHFEKLSRQVGAATNRRATIKLAAAAVAAPVLVRLGITDVEAGLPIVGCKPPGKRCDKDQRCCSGNCRKGICSCVKKGKPCWQPLEGALCCSQRCDNGQCA